MTGRAAAAPTVSLAGTAHSGLADAVDGERHSKRFPILTSCIGSRRVISIGSEINTPTALIFLCLLLGALYWRCLCHRGKTASVQSQCKPPRSTTCGETNSNVPHKTIVGSKHRNIEPLSIFAEENSASRTNYPPAACQLTRRVLPQ